MVATDALCLEYKGTITGLVRAFRKEHGLANVYEDDLISIGYEALLKACATYEPKKLTFVHWAKWMIWRHLLAYTRSPHIQNRDKRVGDDVLVDVPAPTAFNVPHFMALLGHDARQVAQLAIAINQGHHGAPSARKPGATPYARQRKAIVAVLREAGWVGQRITESFNEIREALNA